MKQIYVALTLALAVVASGCSTDDLSDTVRTLPDKPAEKMTIHATTGQQSGTRVAYEDGAAGMNGKLTWQKGDRLTVVRMNGSDYVAYADDYEYGGTEGATSGPFTGTAITDAGNSWTIYYPHTVAVSTYYDTVTLPMTGQTQTADGNTDHLRNYLLLSSTGIKDLDAGFDLEMQNSIMKFEFSNVPAEVGELTRLVWAAETETDSHIRYTHYLMLNFAPGAVTFDADKHTLTAYLAFMPEEMKVKTGGKFTVMLMGDKTYLAETTIDGGKTYAAGMRYTAVVDGTSMKWEEKAVMIFTVRPDNSNHQFNIPFPESGTTPAELTVDWGDGTTPTTVASGTALSSKDAFCHSYSSRYVNYNIIITSGQTDKTLQQTPPFGYDRRGSRGNLISIDTPLLNTAETDFGSCFRSYALRSIPEDLFANNPQATNFSYCFCSCISLRSIPEGLFAHNPQATNFSYCFSETRLQSIPEDLFANNPQATDFSYCFSSCTSLQSVPEGLFANNPQATNFRDCFSGTSLQSVPEGLFANNPQATDFWGCFSGTSLQSVPEGLFAHNPQATDFYHCFSLCTSLQSVPEGLFAHNPQATNFSYCFYQTPLQSVPEGLFAHNPQATNFSFCFYKTLLQSVPEGLFAHNPQATSFSYCFNLTPLQSVPEGLFAHNPQVTDFYHCFSGTSLQSVPEGLFANNPQATDFSGCFNKTPLQSVPGGLFAHNPQATNFWCCFRDCTSLQSVPEGLFTNNTQVTNFKECFRDCTSLESVPTGLFANSPQVKDFTCCFEGCTALQSLPSGLFASTVATDFNCFYRCTSLRSIPADLLAKLPAVTNLSGCFSGCTALRSIPAGLFDKNTRITSFRRCFADCTALNSIPNKLFDNNTSVTDFTGCFEGSSMAVIPKGVFDNNKWVESFENCFKDCLPLRAVPTGLFDKNTRATNFRRCFSGCLYLGMNEAIFSATKDYKQRFPNTNKKMDFRECFKGAGSAYVLPDMMAFTGSAPDLWNYDFGRAGYSSTDCFANVSFYLNNYSIIPSAWGGVKE
ncbi:leucine-rich repeat domain-containing protein [Bacteroides cellulosilyticus]|mgnify:CR=1 FL=1|uniref:leucine-rich repeat protein n=2 Tax=Bacteroides TaxID=816 RepID=UPI001CCAD2A3|nr:leucine-rich repeat protein [Bacteroides cellulosilyticus]UBD68127.1 leucine-rich repeat domain-containing protein [Bacteroides cellulosilyticus]